MEETRKIGKFSCLEVDGACDVEVHWADKPTLTVFAESQQCLDSVVVEQDGNTLTVSGPVMYGSVRSGRGGVVMAIGKHAVAAGRSIINVSGCGNRVSGGARGGINISVTGHGNRVAGGDYYENGKRVTHDSGVAICTEEVRVVIGVPEFKKVEVSGSGDVSVAGFHQGSMELTTRGSGDISFDGIITGQLDAYTTGSGDLSLWGKAGHLNVVTSGSGDIDAMRLESRKATFVSLGSGDIEAHVTGSIGLTALGSGDINVKGSPRVREKQVQGSGVVEIR